MIGLIVWTRSFTFDAHGNMIRNTNGPIFAAHPQPTLWNLLEAEAKDLSRHFDLVQLPPASHGYGEGYSPFELRDLNSNWGSEQELLAAIESCHAAGMLVSADLPFRQMSGANGGPGVFKYGGRPGETTASWFQYFGNTGETIPPFVKQDSVPNTQGNYAFGTVRSYENSIPHGVVEADTKDVLKGMVGLLKIDWARYDDVKGQHQPSVLRIMNTQPTLNFYSEYDSGTLGEVDAWVRSNQFRSAVADYPQYWHTQNACNQYDAELFDAEGGGYWQWYGGYYSIGFVSNPDVATSWSPTGGISQQIAFCLLLGYVREMFLPRKMFLVYGEDYFPASKDFPTGKGLKPFIDNMCWFAKKFAFGKFERRWQDGDVYAYTRDGDGGEFGWSGGCLIVLNFNTYDRRTLDLQTMWPEGTLLHNYSITGSNEYYRVGAGGMLTVTVKANYLSDGQSYLLIAVAGVE